MNQIPIKICGLTREQDVLAAVNAGAAAVGFVLYPPSPRYVSPERAAQSLRFTDTYRSYIINYGLGRDMVQASVERAGPGQAERWTRMIRLLSEPTLPGDL